MYFRYVTIHNMSGRESTLYRSRGTDWEKWGSKNWYILEQKLTNHPSFVSCLISQIVLKNSPSFYMGNGVFKKPEKVHLHTTQITTNFDGPFLLQKRLYYLQKCFGFPQILKSHHRLKKDTIEIPRKTFFKMEHFVWIWYYAHRF